MVTYKHGKGNYKSGYLSTVMQALDLTVNNSTTFVNTDLITPILKFKHSYNIKIYATQNSSTVADNNFHIVVTDLVATHLKWEQTIGAMSLPSNQITTNLEVAGSGADGAILFEFIVLNVTTKGTLQLQYAQKNAEVSNSKFKKGSVMLITEMS